jgi:hypothetical protein
MACICNCKIQVETKSIHEFNEAMKNGNIYFSLLNELIVILHSSLVQIIIY